MHRYLLLIYLKVYNCAGLKVIGILSLQTQNDYSFDFFLSNSLNKTSNSLGSNGYSWR